MRIHASPEAFGHIFEHRHEDLVHHAMACVHDAWRITQVERSFFDGRTTSLVSNTSRLCPSLLMG